MKYSRIDIIDIVGKKYLTGNIENNEFSYQQVLDRPLTGHYKLDIRFHDDKTGISILIETKNRFKDKDEQQLFDYIRLETELSDKTKIIGMLVSLENGDIKAWKIVDGQTSLLKDKRIKSFENYVEYFSVKNTNNKIAVLENTSLLNKQLHNNGISENLRSQFVGTCLLALKNKLSYRGMSTSQIIAGIRDILGNMLTKNLDKATKIAILDNMVLRNQNVENMPSENFVKLLNFIKNKILPYINDESYEGQDILSYFFTTFNKYVSREDNNQAYTPNHIAHFMCKVGRINRYTRLLDPTCGSGTFLVQGMNQAISKCETLEEQTNVKTSQIYGIEYEDKAFGLATTNMLIHGDGNSNIIKDSCFDRKDWIKNADINLVLMNPPYSASKVQVPKEFAKNWGKKSKDPSKGLYFVKFISETVGKGRLITLLPLSCAITTKGIIHDIKKELLEHNTLDAVFSLPSDMFYPGASAVACCMVFDLGIPHKDSDKDTFFGYFKYDGFEKRKNVGRVDVRDTWNEIEKEWLDLYEHRQAKPGISVTKKVNEEMEWCAEAYMETDYSTLTDDDFVRTMQSFASFLTLNEKNNEI